MTNPFAAPLYFQRLAPLTMMKEPGSTVCKALDGIKVLHGDVSGIGPRT